MQTLNSEIRNKRQYYLLFLLQIFLCLFPISHSTFHIFQECNDLHSMKYSGMVNSRNLQNKIIFHIPDVTL